MNLQELIAYLEALPEDTVFPIGFTRAHSYRGYYDHLAFEPTANYLVGYMLAVAKEALGKEFTGYKGGTYFMGGDTPVWLSRYGESGGIRLSGRVLEAFRTLALPDQESNDNW